MADRDANKAKGDAFLQARRDALAQRWPPPRSTTPPVYVHQAVPLVAPASAVFADGVKGDFTLAAGSPAIRAGVSVPGLTTDLTGAAYATPPSLGAAEYTTPPPEPEPPTPGVLVLACEGTVQAVPGPVNLTCVQQTGGSR